LCSIVVIPAILVVVPAKAVFPDLHGIVNVALDLKS